MEVEQLFDFILIMVGELDFLIRTSFVAVVVVENDDTEWLFGGHDVQIC